jgi:hypothetical protein
MKAYYFYPKHDTTVADCKMALCSLFHQEVETVSLSLNFSGIGSCLGHEKPME